MQTCANAGVAKNGCGRRKLKRSTEEMTLAKQKTRKAVQGCPGLFRAVQGCSGLFRAVQGWMDTHACKVVQMQSAFSRPTAPGGRVDGERRRRDPSISSYSAVSPTMLEEQHKTKVGMMMMMMRSPICLWLMSCVITSLPSISLDLGNAGIFAVCICLLPPLPPLSCPK